MLNKICVIQCEASALTGLSGVRAVSFLVPFISLFSVFISQNNIVESAVSFLTLRSVLFFQTPTYI